MTWIGIVAAVPALWFVSGAHGQGNATHTDDVANGLIASIGFAVQYLALAQAGPDSGIWPVVGGRVTATIAIIAMAKPARAPLSLRLSLPIALGAAATGVGAALALILFLLATQRSLVVVAVVLSSLYPVLPVLLGIAVLRERLTRRQAAGLIAAGASVVLITAS